MLSHWVSWARHLTPKILKSWAEACSKEHQKNKSQVLWIWQWCLTKWSNARRSANREPQHVICYSETWLDSIDCFNSGSIAQNLPRVQLYMFHWFRSCDGVQQKCDEQELEDQWEPQKVDLQLAEKPGNPQSLESRWGQASLAAQCVHAWKSWRRFLCARDMPSTSDCAPQVENDQGRMAHLGIIIMFSILAVSGIQHHHVSHWRQTVSEEIVAAWTLRAMNEHDQKAGGKHATVKQKAGCRPSVLFKISCSKNWHHVHRRHCDTDLPPWQKSAQRDAAKMLELMDLCCLWESVKGGMALSVGNSKMQEIREMWESGILVLALIYSTKLTECIMWK